MALRYWLNVNGGAKNDKSGSPSGHLLQSRVCTYSFIVAVPLKGDPMVAGFLLLESGSLARWPSHALSHRGGRRESRIIRKTRGLVICDVTST